MTHRTMRDFLAALEKKGMLRRIKKSVDRSWEPAALAKWMYQAMPAEDRFGMYFEKVEGSSIPLVTGALGASKWTYATALDVEPDEINAAWMRACRNPIKPRVVDQGLCQEVVILGKDIRLSYLPIPVWTPGKDAGPYITTNVVTRDFDTGVQNVGVYRTMVRDETSVAVNLHIHRHGFEHMFTWTDKGKPMPIAWVIAAPPAVQLSSVILMPNGIDEVTLAGGMMGKAVDVVKCKTNDLMVPADAEIIIEGEIYPNETCEEGPFGEFAGYMGEVVTRPIAHITAITHRKDPVYYGFTSQMPPSESTSIQSLANAGVLQKKLVDDMGEKSVTDVFIDLFFAGVLGHAIIAMKPLYPGHAKKVGRLVAAMSPIKRVTIVDPDVDIRDPHHLDWALNSRFNPVRDVVIVEDVFFPLDPSVRDAHSDNVMGSKMICDCTAKTDAGTFSLPPKDIMDKALKVWKEVDLPPFDIPKRAKLRFEVS